MRYFPKPCRTGIALSIFLPLTRIMQHTSWSFAPPATSCQCHPPPDEVPTKPPEAVSSSVANALFQAATAESRSLQRKEAPPFFQGRGPLPHGIRHATDFTVHCYLFLFKTSDKEHEYSALIIVPAGRPVPCRNGMNCI